MKVWTGWKRAALPINNLKVVTLVSPQHIWVTSFWFYFFNVFYWLCYCSCLIPPPLFPSTLHTPFHLHCPPPQFMSIGRTYKFFGFYISYTILTLPLSILYLPFMLIPCAFPPTDNPPCDLHFCNSVSVLVVCLVYFCFILGSGFNTCEFVVILLFIFLIIFFFLD